MVSGVSMLGGRGEWVTATRWAGSGVMIVGLGMLMLEGGHDAAMPNAWFGDLLFIAAGGLWTSYTFMLRRSEPVLAVSAVNVMSGVMYLPVFVVMTRGTLPPASWVEFAQSAMIQGVIAAFFTVYAYAQSVKFLGAAKAAVFPAAVAPCLAIGYGGVGQHPDTSTGYRCRGGYDRAGRRGRDLATSEGPVTAPATGCEPATPRGLDRSLVHTLASGRCCTSTTTF
jgi:drug/metabolite transporter (DMT)-like permease